MLLPWSTLWLALGGAIVWFFIFACIGIALRAALGAAFRPLVHFDNLIAGIVLFAVAYAIMRTRCHTILLPVPLFVCAALRGGNSIGVYQNNTRARWQVEAIAGIAVLLLAGIFFAQGLYAFGSNMQPYPASDLNYYCRLARHLQRFGAENVRLDLPAAMQGVTELYHWGDEWLLAGVSRLSGMQEEVVLLLIIYPILAATTVLGLFSFFERYWPGRKWLLAGICAASLLACAMPGTLPALIRERYAPFSAAVLQFPKQLLPGILILWLAHAIRRKEWTTVFFIAAASGLLFINMLPALLLWTMMLIGILIRRGRWTKNIGISIAFCIGCLAATALFVFWPISHGDAYLPPLRADYIGNPALRLHILLQGFVQYLAFLPFALLPAFFWWRARNRSFALWAPGERAAGSLLLMLTICGAFAWSLFYPLSQDSQQFFHNVVHAALPPGVVWCATLLFCRNAGRLYRWLFCGLLAWCAGTNLRFSRFPHMTGIISANDLAKAKVFFSQNPLGERLLCLSYLADSAGAANGAMRRATVNFYPLELLSMLRPGYTVYSLNPVHFPDAQDIHAREEWRAKWLSPLMQYAHAKGLQNSDAVGIQQAFIKASGAQYLIVKEGLQVPGFVKPMVTDSLVFRSVPYHVYRLRLTY